MRCSEGFLHLERSQVLAAGLQQPIVSARQMTVRETELNFTWKCCKEVMYLLRLAGICSRCIVQATESSLGWICRGQMGWSAMANHALHPTCLGAILASSHVNISHMFCWEGILLTHVPPSIQFPEQWLYQLLACPELQEANVVDFPVKCGLH